MPFNTNIINSIQTFLLVTKFHHWNTKIYNTHKITDQMYGDFQSFIDKFTEVYMGFTGEKFSSGSETTFNVRIPVDDNGFLNEVKSFRKFLYELEKSGNLSGDLNNIVQEMQSSINQYILLLSYK